MDWQFWWKILTNTGLRYFILAGVSFLLFYVWWRPRFSYKKIQQRFPQSKDYAREIGYSILTIFIFSLVPTILISVPTLRKHTTLYQDIHQYGILYFGLAFLFMLLLHDTYFYWLHRLMHHPFLFRVVHLVHHRSTNPSPWAAYAFHPLEAFAEAGIYVIFLFTLPVTFYHIGFFFLFMIIYNVYGHLGWELYPRRFNRHWLGKWINTSVSHNMHHQYFKGNYGLYFTFWDRIMGTLHPDYDKQFEEITLRRLQ